MDIITILLVGAVLLISLLYVGKFWKYSAKVRSQINKLPGPPAYPIIGTSYIIIGVPRTGVLKLFEKLINKYGSIFRSWLGSQPVVHLTQPEHMQEIMNSTKHIQKSNSYKFMKLLLGDGLVTSSGPKWHSHRKMISPAFHLTILEDFIHVFSEKSAVLMDKLQQKADGNGFDIYPYITRCAFDIICETAMGVPTYAQEDPDSEYFHAVSELAEMITDRGGRIWMHPDFIYFNTPTGRKFREGINKVHGFATRVIQERKSALSSIMNSNHESSDEDRSLGINKKKRKAFLDLLLETCAKEGQLSDEDIKHEVDTFMIAGHDTTASSISWTLFMLGHHPEVQENVYAELSEVFQGSNRTPTMQDLNEMKYLERVIKETLRLYPTVPVVQRLLTEDIRIDGYDIPAGTVVTMWIYFVHRNPKYFPNPEQFNPDNFLPERVQQRHHLAFIPFSAGPRNCIGQKFALLEEKTMLSTILRRFTVRSLEKPEDVKSVPAITLRPESGVNVVLTARS